MKALSAKALREIEGECRGYRSKLFSIIFEKGLARCGVGCYSSPPADATHEAKLKNRATKVG
ncbi:hypothetical protein, partial [uncultured Herbaspirillum sp.]|uniref:hypothetical protein n=1 Tax=uncultured Herbaspirillum sp. TaxID=160236 RepID=UPI002584D83E